MTEDYVVVGRIGAPQGLRGWVHVQSYTDPLDNLLSYRPWYLQATDGGQWVCREQVQVRPNKKAFVASFEGIEDRDAAAKLRGALIGVVKTQLANPAANETYWHDLVGCDVHNEAGRLGTVVSLMETGVHDVLVVRDASVEPPMERLIPFVERYIETVAVTERLIRVNWQTDW